MAWMKKIGRLLKMLGLVVQPTVLLFACAMNSAHSQSAQSAVTNLNRPDTWWRPIVSDTRSWSPRAYGFWVPSAYVQAPHTSPEVYLWKKTKNRFSPKMNMDAWQYDGYLKGFFGQEIIKLKKCIFSLDDSPDRYSEVRANPLSIRCITKNGQIQEYVSIGVSETDYRKLEGKPPMPVQGSSRLVLTSAVAEPSYVGDLQARWVNPKSEVYALDMGNDCDPLTYAMQALDSGGKVQWQRMFAAHGDLVKRSTGRSTKLYAYTDSCFGPGQYYMATPKFYSLTLNDGTALIDLGFGVLRIRVAEGRPDIIPPNVSVIEYADVMRMKHLIANVSHLDRCSISVITRQALPGADKALDCSNNGRTNYSDYMLLQAYVFPQLISRVVRGLNP